MKKILYTDFTSTEELMEELLSQKEFKKAVTRSNLYKFWAKVAGEKFAKYSRPYSLIGGGVMVIACENPVIAQELLLKKTQILVRFKPYVESLKITLKDLRFDTKKWVNEEE